MMPHGLNDHRSLLPQRIDALVRAEGSGGRPHLSWIRANATSADGRALVDGVHFVCALYGGHPSSLDMAGAHDPSDVFLSEAAGHFSAERALLARLAAAMPPLPSTPGHGEAEAALVHQRHAVETLAASERPGCAQGFAAALLLDWPAIRTLLLIAGVRAGIAMPPSPLPAPAEVRTWLAVVPDAHARAVHFGADQLVSQHRGLWALLEARHQARTGPVDVAA